MAARYSLSFTSVTPTGTADATNLVDSTYDGLLLGGSGTQLIRVNEIYLGGEAPSTSSPTLIVLARDSTVAASVTAGSTRNALTDSLSTAPASTPIAGNNATTKPQRSATLHLLHLSFNAYGGVLRWFARPGEEHTVYGNTASLGEVSLSAYSGGTPGQHSGHILYEVA